MSYGCRTDYVRISYGLRKDVGRITYGCRTDWVRLWCGSRTDCVRISHGYYVRMAYGCHTDCVRMSYRLREVLRNLLLIYSDRLCDPAWLQSHRPSAASEPLRLIKAGLSD